MGSWDRDWGFGLDLGLELGVGDQDWGFGDLGSGDWGLELEIEIWD